MKPSNYETSKSQAAMDKPTYPISARLGRLRNHMEQVHGAAPEDYGNNVLGWHRKNHPGCTTATGL